MLLTVTRLSLSHAGLPSQSVGVWGVPPAAGGKRKMVFRGLPRACWEFYGKRSFSVTTPCASPTRVDTERLAERETLLHRLGSKLNRTVFNSCGNSLSVAEKHVTFPQPGFFANRVFFTKFTIFGNTKQVIQDYDTVFDNSIPFRKNDPLRITYFRIPGVPGLHLCLGTGRRRV